MSFLDVAWFNFSAFVAGALVLILGLGLLAGRRHSARQTMFGLFLAFWGIQNILANMGAFIGYSESSVRTIVLWMHALFPPIFLFLGRFIAIQAPVRLRATITILAFATASVAAIAFVGFFDRFLLTVDGSGTIAYPVYSKWKPLVFDAPFFGFLLLAVAALYRTARNAPTGSNAREARALFLAMGSYCAYTSVRFFLVFAGTTDPGVLFDDEPGQTALIMVLGLTAGVCLAIATFHVLRPTSLGRRDPILAWALLVPSAVAAIEYVISDASGSFISTLAFWRVLMVAVIAYHLARHELFDLDLTLQRVAAPAAVATLLLLTAGAVALAWTSGAETLFLVALAATGLLLATAALLLRDPIARRLDPAKGDPDQFLHMRKLEVYRASMERAIVARKGTDEGELLRLRKSLGISEREHQVMEYMVRRSSMQRLPPDPKAPPVAGPGALLLDRYRVERLLGEGAHGRAYLAHDDVLGRDVVVKAVGTVVYGGRAARLLVREARIAGSLRHDNVIQIHDVSESDREAFIVMEYADGGNLHGLLRRKGRLDLYQSVYLLDQMLAGLGAAHAKGIIHRDIKPENLLLTKDGGLKIADFGVARETRPDATGLEGGALGTLLYMSPEQVRGIDVDARSDLYAAAVVFHQVLTGRYYQKVAGKDDFQLRQQILKEPGDLALGGHPSWVGPFLRQALAKEPDERFPDAATMRQALQELAASELDRAAATPRGTPAAGPA
ncbi:MAG: serine/threonine-protein kinase [Thermoplasmatota archaeon]